MLKHVSEIWRSALAADEAANNSNKRIIVTAGQEWEILSIWAEFATSNMAGNRQIAVSILDSADDVIGVVLAGIVQAADTSRYYLFAPALADLTSVRGSFYLTTPIPRWILPPGYKIQIRDKEAKDLSHDDLGVQILYRYREV